MSNLDFTLTKFKKLCTAITAGYPTITLAEYFSAKDLPERFAILRHDIDRRAGRAVDIANIEADSGINATYYFRTNSNVFKPELIRGIEGMGHEVGYHYEVLGKAKGDHKKAIGLFRDELSKFREICDVKTICMHGNPLSKYGDIDLWKNYSFKDYGILGEAYLSAGKDLIYFSDTGRSWNSRNNVRDFIPGRGVENTASSTDDLVELIESKRINRLYILTHPERWGDGVDWCYSFVMDALLNTGKRVLIALRGRS